MSSDVPLSDFNNSFSLTFILPTVFVQTNLGAPILANMIATMIANTPINKKVCPKTER